MPDGLHLSNADFYGATINVGQYLEWLEAYLERMLSFRAIDEDTAVRRFTEALTTLNYKDYATYVASKGDVRIINPSAPDIPSWEKPSFWESTYTRGLYSEEPGGITGKKGVTTPAMVMPGLQVPNARLLPYFKQVVAPIVYQREAQRQALQFGYIDKEGAVLNEARYNTLLRGAIQDSEEYRYDFIQDVLGYELQEAKAANDTERADLITSNQVKVEEFLGQKRQQAALVEGQISKAQKRAEAWQEELAAPKAPSPEMPSGEEAIREFVEEERPGGLQRFIESELPGVLGTYQREEERARKSWWTSINRPSYEQTLSEAERELKQWVTTRAEGAKAGWGKELAVQAAEKGAPLTGQEVSPSQWAYLQAGQRMTQASQRLYDLRGMSPEQAQGRFPTVTAERKEDPLVSYLEEYPWQSEWLKLSPGQRGYSPARFKPAARWFV